MQKTHLFNKNHVPWNAGTGGCKRGHDPSLYVKSSGGIHVCLECKRENNRRYKKRRRGDLPVEERFCICGCGGQPKKGQWLRGHNRKAENPVSKSESNRLWRVDLRVVVLSRYGVGGKPVCVNCGFTDIRALSIDHKNGSGNTHRREIKKWLYLWLRQQGFPPEYQTLCMNCQMIKAVEQNERSRSYIAIPTFKAG